jgi:hypothetical protein
MRKFPIWFADEPTFAVVPVPRIPLDPAPQHFILPSNVMAHLEEACAPDDMFMTGPGAST